MSITAPRETMVWNLRAYGEDEVADALQVAPEQTLFDAWRASGQAGNEDGWKSFIDHYLALGAVRAITGESRPLRRKRRKFVEPEPQAEISAEQYAAFHGWSGVSTNEH